MENHSVTAEKHPRREITRTRSHEDKVEMQGNHEEVQGRELRGQETWSCNGVLIEATELEHMMSQAAQDLNDFETRHESREPQGHEQEHLLEREELQWTKHADNSSTRNDS